MTVTKRLLLLLYDVVGSLIMHVYNTRLGMDYKRIETDLFQSCLLSYEFLWISERFDGFLR